ncbi:MAG TPA: hypothetical protein VD706_01885 [Candidatus Saccharimonadales bacterium]|nr:hypothetical protein [Candidatus Saccharimonadales bacterium]
MNASTMPQQSQEIESELRLSAVDPEALGPEDFYWWNMEQAGGDLVQAVQAVDTPEDSVKFVLGMEAHLLEIWSEGSRERIPAHIRNSVYEAFQSDRAANGTDGPGEQAQWWEQALAIPVLTLAAEKFRPVAEHAAGTRPHLRSLFLLAVRESQDRFNLSDANIRELELIASGATPAELAAERGVDPRVVSKERIYPVKKLKAGTQHHAVRLGIEHGFIKLDKVPDGSSDVVLPDGYHEILELYSRGLYEPQIAETVDKSIDTVSSSLHLMLDKFSANGRMHLIKRAFEEGILQPDPQSNVHLDIGARLLGRVEQQLLRATGQLDGVIDPEGYKQVLADLIDGSSSVNPAATSFSKDVRTRVAGLEDAFRTVGGIAGDIFAGMQGAYAAVNIGSGVLNPRMQEELELAARGVDISERAGSERERNSINHARRGMRKKLGALSFPHAVRRAVETGHLSLDLPAPERKIAIANERIATALELISRGYSTQEAAEATFMSKRTFLTDINKARDHLQANDPTHLVARAFEERILLPEGPNTGLYVAFARLEDSVLETGQTLAYAIDALANVDPTALNRKLSGLTDAELHELDWTAGGRTPEEAATAEGVNRDTIYARHTHIRSKLGAHSMAHAVQLSIERGMIEVPENDSCMVVPPGMRETLAAIANGHIANEIADEEGRARPTMYGRLTRIRQRLSALTTPQAVLRTHEEGVLSVE